ncbi:DUF1697 domain-containing protein [Gammaproteobacteria bacterium]|nr:DUF1697 domain-containing protein [Gammaproteobacteria bacterium]
METYIALLRGINVGGKHILPMKNLVELLEGLQLKNIKTYIQSGNVAFQSKKIEKNRLAERIADKINNKFYFSPQVFVLDKKEFKRAVDLNPYSEVMTEGKNLHLTFLLHKPINPEIDSLQALQKNDEKFTLIDKVFYLYAPEGIGRSKLAGKIEKLLGVKGTTRNWNSVMKIKNIVESYAN